MTDEQIGRAWCAANGRRPDYRPERNTRWRYRWVYDDGPEYALPKEVFNRLYKPFYDTEADAYTAVGEVVMEIVHESERLRRIADGVLHLLREREVVGE
jgi:hypothetical protein